MSSPLERKTQTYDLTFAAFVNHKFVFYEFSEDLVAAAMFEAGNGRKKTHWDNFMVFHPHLNLWEKNLEKQVNIWERKDWNIETFFSYFSNVLPFIQMYPGYLWDSMS